MNKNKKEIVIYQAPSGAIELHGDFKKETFWTTQAQIVRLFSIDQSVVSRHINNIFKDGEIDKKSNMQKMHIANSDKPVILYSLDVVLGVGYRANSKVAIEFRRWATKTLREHIIKGFTINRKRISRNYDKFMEAVEGLKNLLPNSRKVDAKDALELIKMFALTWVSLEAYDKNKLDLKGVTKKKVVLTAAELKVALADLKKELLKQREASSLFGQEKQQEVLVGIVGNIFQSFDKKDVYPTIEEKAAHLLYFVVKNHPYVDGNKRSGAFAFIWFLQRTGILNTKKITPESLTALTLLVAESNPKDKDRMIGLILMLLGKN